MGRRGFSPIPTAIKLLEGNPGRRPLNKREPKPKEGVPYCPSWLCDEAKKHWKRTAATLKDMGLLTIADGDALANYCDTWAQWREMREFIKKHGPVMPIRGKDGEIKYIQQAPQVNIARHLLLILGRYQLEFGLTPSARTRIHVEQPSPEADDFERFLARRDKIG